MTWSSSRAGSGWPRCGRWSSARWPPRRSYRRVCLVAGARSPAEFLFRGELDDWSGRADLEVELTIDQPAAGWDGQVGFVTEPLARLPLDPDRTTAFLCGPEPMMRFSAQALLRKGVPAGDIRVSLERNMKCGIGLCGHCQLGPILVCRDGPVVGYAARRAAADRSGSCDEPSRPSPCGSSRPATAAS